MAASPLMHKPRRIVESRRRNDDEAAAVDRWFLAVAGPEARAREAGFGQPLAQLGNRRHPHAVMALTHVAVADRDAVGLDPPRGAVELARVDHEIVPDTRC